MALRSHETPMEFQWTNAGGPVSHNSEFQRAIDRNGVKSQDLTKKRPHSIFDSPNKSGIIPSLHTPATPAHPALFDTKPLPTTPFKSFSDISFNVPRNFDTEFYSSGPENDTSPEQNADSEATPDMGIRSVLSKTRFAGAQPASASQDKQSTIFGRAVASPGKGELPRGNYSNAIERRVHKRRRRDGDRQLARRRWRFGSDSDHERIQETPLNDRSDLSQNGPSAASIFKFIETHPDLPHILSFYAQLLLNVFLVFFFIYIIYSFWSTIRADVDKKSQEAISDILADMAKCAQNYQDNFCQKENRAPALMVACENWDRCMNKDPQAVGRARVSAHTFAEIFNSFIEPISYKAMIFSLILVFGCVAISNFAFGFFRNRAHPPPQPTSYMSTQTQRYPIGTPGFWTPYQSQMAHEPNPSIGALAMQTPARRLQYE